MSQAPPMHALTGPARYGLTPVDILFGEVRSRPEREVLVVSDPALDADGHLVVFLGMDGDRQPILVVPPEDPTWATSPRARHNASTSLHAMRLRWVSP